MIPAIKSDLAGSKTYQGFIPAYVQDRPDANPLYKARNYATNRMKIHLISMKIAYLIIDTS